MDIDIDMYVIVFIVWFKVVDVALIFLERFFSFILNEEHPVVLVSTREKVSSCYNVSDSKDVFC